MVDQKTLREFITWNDAFNTQAKFAKAKRMRGTRYIVVEPGMETGWFSHSLGNSMHFEHESTARQHAEKHHGIAYPTFFDGIPAPFGSVLIFEPERGVQIISPEDFAAEWEDYVPDAEEQAWLKAELGRRGAMQVEIAAHKLNRAVGTDTPIDDAFIETIDPLAPEGPGDPPGRSDPNT